MPGNKWCSDEIDSFLKGDEQPSFKDSVRLECECTNSGRVEALQIQVSDSLRGYAFLF